MGQLPTTLEDEKWASRKSLKVVIYPDPVLTTVAGEVTEITPEIKELCLDMVTTMYRAVGAGIAGPQVGVSKRIFIMDTTFDMENISDDEKKPHYLMKNLDPVIVINPIILEKRELGRYREEGCLSLPGIYEKVDRYKEIDVEYTNLDGEKVQKTLNGLESICYQHELDHLNGIVTLDRLSGLKKNFLKKKLMKLKK